MGTGPEEAPTLVLLHEGLGCVALWRDVPAKLAAMTGYGVFAYSRLGYGQSDSVALPRPLTYMHDEARDVLSRVLDAQRIRRCVLVGHSDGASIALIYAGSHQDRRVRGIALLAPHVMVEPFCIGEIERARERWNTTDLRRAHGEVPSRPGLRLPRLERRLARSRLPRASSTCSRRSRMSACRSWSCRARPTPTARSSTCASSSARPIARWTA